MYNNVGRNKRGTYENCRISPLLFQMNSHHHLMKNPLLDPFKDRKLGQRELKYWEKST